MDALIRVALGAVLAAAVSAASAARAGDGAAEDASEAEGEVPARGCLSIPTVPDDARVELDGRPLSGEDRDLVAECLPVDAGAYLVTVFHLEAPPFEAFVDVAAGKTAIVAYVKPAPPAAIAVTTPPPRRDPTLGPTLVAGAFVAAGSAAVLWQLSNHSERAAQEIRVRDDLDETTRSRILADLDARRGLRRDAAAISAAAGAALLVAGTASWALTGNRGQLALDWGPGYGGVLAEVRLP